MKESDFKEMLDILIYATEKENIEIIKALLKDFDNFTNEEKGLVLHVLSFSLKNVSSQTSHFVDVLHNEQFVIVSEHLTQRLLESK